MLSDFDPLELLEELRRRSEHEYHKYAPLDGQLEFHKSTKYIKLLFGGNQSGKSRANAQEIAWRLTKEHPHKKVPKRALMIWVVSTEYQTIRAGIYRHLVQILPPWEIQNFGPKVQGHDMASYIRMKNGSQVYFLSSKGGDDSRTKFQAEAVDYVAIDEEIENWIWDELQARLLATGGDFGISATLVESYDWIVELESRAVANDPDVFLARLDTRKNPYLNQEQVNRLVSKWDPVTREYRIEGKSRRSTGLVYPHFDHWIPPFNIPKRWTKYHGLDPGFRVCAGLWGAVTEFGQLIFYRELYQEYSDLGFVANEIRQVEKLNNNDEEEIHFRVIDDKEGSHTVTGAVGPLTVLANEYGLYYSPAIKSKLAGIESVRMWLKKHDTNEFYTYKLDDGTEIKLPKGQRLFVFNTLEYFKYEITRYKIAPPKERRDRNEPLDTPIKAKDHLMDVLRYIIMLSPSYSTVIEPQALEKRMGSSSLEEVFERMWERKSRTRSLLGGNL